MLFLKLLAVAVTPILAAAIGPSAKEALKDHLSATIDDMLKAGSPAARQQNVPNRQQNYVVNNLSNSEKIEKFFKLLETDGRFTFIVRILRNLVTHKNLIKNTYENNIPSVEIVQRLISNKIGLCHLKNSGLSGYRTEAAKKEKIKVYLQEFVITLETAVNIFYEKIAKFNSQNKKMEYIQKVLDQYELNLGGRPCLDNALEELMNAIMKPGFIWKGKTIPLNLWLEHDIQKYKNEILAPAIMSYYQSLNTNNLTIFKKKPKTKKIKQMWNFFQNKPLYTRLGPLDVPAYWDISHISRYKRLKIKKISTDTMKEYVNYMV